MKKTRFITLSLAAASLLLLAAANESTAGVQVSINFPVPVPAVVAPPPVVALPAPPRHVAVIHTDVYYYPDAMGTLYYDGYWYRPRGGAWYRAVSYGGPWGYIARHRVPRSVVVIPSGGYGEWRDRRHGYDDHDDYRRGRQWRRWRHHDDHD